MGETINGCWRESRLLSRCDRLSPGAGHFAIAAPESSIADGSPAQTTSVYMATIDDAASTNGVTVLAIDEVRSEFAGLGEGSIWMGDSSGEVGGCDRDDAIAC